MDVSGILAMVKGLFDKLEKENVIKLPDNFDNLWDEIETTKPDTDTVTITGTGNKDVTGTTDKTNPETAPETPPSTQPKTLKTGSSVDPYTGETINAHDVAWYGSGPLRRKQDLIDSCTKYPEIYQPFVEAGLVRINEYGDYEIADQDAVDRFYGDDKGISMDELKGLLKGGAWGQDFDPEKIREFVKNQPPLATPKTLIENLPDEGVTQEEFVNLYKQYPDIMQIFVDCDMINLNQWGDPYSGNGYNLITKDTGKISKETLTKMLVDGTFDADKIIEVTGRSNWSCYKNLAKTKAEFVQQHKANYEAAQRYMDYYNSLSYEDQKAHRTSDSTYRSVEYYLEQYNDVMNDPFGGDISRKISRIRVYVLDGINSLEKTVKNSHPELF